MTDVAPKDSAALPPAIVTAADADAAAVGSKTAATTATSTPPAAASPESAAAGSRNARRGKGAARSPTGGHYADPLSPIASTPLKRQRAPTPVKATPGGDSSVKKHKSDASTPAATATAAVTSDKSKDAFLSPRKLVHEYDAEEKQADDAQASRRSRRASSERHPPPLEAEAASGDDELFSPVLKPPRATRSSSNASPANGAQPPGKAVDAATALLSSSSTCSEQNDDEDEDEDGGADTEGEEDKSRDAADEDEDGELGGSDSASDASGSEQEFNPFYFMKTLPKYEDIVTTPRPIALPAKSRNAPKISLVLDLDETLVHCSVDDVENPHLQFPVTFNGVEYTVKVKKRPHMEYFLKRVAQLFEVVVFTASHRAYAETLLNLLDPHRQLIKYRLYRDDCLDVYGNYLKDLNVLGRDLSKVLLVDNSPHAFGYQVGNGVPIETWYDDEADDELLSLLPFLESLADVDDVRPIVAKQFQIQKLIDATPDEIV